MVIDRPSEPGPPEPPEPRDAAPSSAAIDAGGGATDPGAAALRTPGSTLVLPANPLQDLSDKSLEGFVDCTLYEETEDIFHPGADGPEWSDLAAEPPAAPASPPPATVPAMPFDTPPDLTVRALGRTESLALAPGEPAPASARPQSVSGELDGAPPAPAPEVPPRSWSVSGELDGAPSAPAPEVAPGRPLPRMITPPPRPATGAPIDLGGGPDPAWFDGVRLPHAGAPAAELADHPLAPGMPAEYPAPPPGMPAEYWIPPPGMPPVDPSIPAPGPASDHAVAAPGLGHVDPGPFGPAGYPVMDGGLYPQYGAPQLVALPAPPIARAQPAWRRRLLIVGSAAVAIALAFVIARLVRGSDRAAPAVAIGAPTSRSALAPARPAAGTAALAAAEPDGESTAEPAGGAGADDDVPDGNGEAAAGAPRIVGSGPCRFTVATTPAGSIIRFDDQAVGPSPITIAGSCDKHKIDASHARYQSATRWVTLTADQPQELDISLQRPIHAVTVTSFPPGAALAIDGHRAGSTPTVVQMMGFATVNLTFTKPGFRTMTKKVYSKLPQDRVFVKLSK